MNTRELKAEELRDAELAAVRHLSCALIPSENQALLEALEGLTRDRQGSQASVEVDLFEVRIYNPAPEFNIDPAGRMGYSCSTHIMGGVTVTSMGDGNTFLVTPRVSRIMGGLVRVYPASRQFNVTREGAPDGETIFKVDFAFAQTMVGA